MRKEKYKDVFDLSLIDFKEKIEDNEINITAYYANNKIGSITFEYFSRLNEYEFIFDEIFTRYEFDDIYKDNLILKLVYVEVSDGLKKKGIGSELMRRGMELVKSMEYKQFYLYSRPIGFKTERFS